ncbi:MAG: hypothetical protein KJ583_05045 [Nanoarchaeota archaeon]|nr:hypothetical protein [Nanoarchaeota archaeon]MBU1270341.1 hypothetical protein [Nanoarchaeota archaeon]MBU1604656.1 hypothetical protein [Nanoarchaeota archaeon]MBU2443133.1 hypothetical protein [Nanoarchaeota archaeon]
MASPPIFIPDITQTYSKEQLIVPPHYKEDISAVLIPSGLIKNRVEKLTREIYSEYYNKKPHFLYVLEGAFKFFSDIQHFYMELQSSDPAAGPFSFGSVSVSSYKDDKSTGNIEITVSPKLKKISGREVVIIEDIVDSGKTITGYTKPNKEKVPGLLQELEKYKPSSIKVVSLLLKRNSESNGFVPDFIGFSIPNAFVVGYGLDYNEHLRDINHICTISLLGEQKYKDI